MAEPFETRAKTALENPDFRLAHFGPLITEAEQLAEEQRQIATLAATESVDFSLAEADRDAAAERAERARRNASAYAAAAEALTAKHAERRLSEKSGKMASERAAAIAERDALAERFSAVARPAIDALAGIFGEVQANAARLKKAGLREPDAEAKARGLRGWNAKSYLDLQIPAWSGPGRAWPPLKQRPDRNAPIVQSERRLSVARNNEEAAHWGRYRVHPIEGQGTSFIVKPGAGECREPVKTIYAEPYEGQIRHTEAERLRKLGARVDSLDLASIAAE